MVGRVCMKAWVRVAIRVWGRVLRLGCVHSTLHTQEDVHKQRLQ